MTALVSVAFAIERTWLKWVPFAGVGVAVRCARWFVARVLTRVPRNRKGGTREPRRSLLSACVELLCDGLVDQFFLLLVVAVV